MQNIAANLSAVRARIAEAARAAGRNPDDVTLVAVAKTFGPEAVEAALAAGQRVFGENRVQEAQRKYPAFRERFPDLELHLIGPLQTNKAREAVALFDVIQSVDRPKLAAALAKEMDRAGRRPACFIQVNTGEEPQKAGIPPGDADAFIDEARRHYGLPVEGLMCIPPVDESPALHFALLREIARRNGLSKLSMGMSGDFELAIRFGATHVRVGSAIFGERPPPPIESDRGGGA
ncbi:MAG TPA: YggS family pyridoxal phosphate-dependent enzyme [Alphaproteobacteria bacterium]